MTDLYRASRLFRDSETRLVIPNLKVTALNAITNIASSYVTNPSRKGSGRFFTYKNDDDWKLGTQDPTANAFGVGLFSSFDSFITGMLARIINIATIGLGVTKIQTSQEYTMPFSKGIGSTGEVIHLLGAKNEMINLEFTTEKYPGRLAYVLRGMLQYILEEAQVVYLVDDLFLATPCLVRKTKLSKEGLYRGAVMGELELVSLTTGGSFYNNPLSKNKKLRGYTNKLKGSVANVASKGTSFALRNPKLGAAIISVGAIAIASTLLPSIVGFSGG